MALHSILKCLCRFVALALPALAAAQSAAGADDGPVLHILADDYPPYSYVAEDGSFTGLATERVRALMAATGLTYEITVVSWARAFARASSEPNILIYSLSKTDERTPNFHWLLPLKRAEFHLFGRSEPQLIALQRHQIVAGPYLSICEARTVQCQLLAQYGFPPDRILQPVINTAGRLRLILRGRADFMIAEPRDIAWHTAAASLPVGAVVSYGLVETGTVDYLAASLGTDPAVVARLKAAAHDIPMIDDTPALPP